MVAIRLDTHMPSSAEQPAHHDRDGAPGDALIPWRVARLQDAELPDFLRRSLVPDEPVEQPCDLCEMRTSLANVLTIDGPEGLPVPFLVCAACERALRELHALLRSAGAQRQRPGSST